MKDNEITRYAESLQDYMVEMRRKFHEHPELSGEEHETRKILIEEIEKMGLKYRLLPGTGIIAFIEGAQPGKNRLLRADIDGLPVQEEEVNLSGHEKVCVSKEPGRCHACGHDVHMTVQLGTMKLLTHFKDRLKGTVYCCFEEGEETNCGIATMMEALQDYQIDECYGMHVYNLLEAGKVDIQAGPRMAGMLRFGVKFKGRAGHGSRPDQSLNPIPPAVHALSMVDSAMVNKITAGETVTVGFSKFVAGSQYNVIPEEAVLEGSGRYFNREEGEKVFGFITKIMEDTADSFGCRVEFLDTHKIALLPVVNDAAVSEKVLKGVAETCGEDCIGDAPLWFGSETYSRYMEKCPGVLALLGIKNDKLGSGAAHHNGKFDVDESVMPLGVCAAASFVFAD